MAIDENGKVIFTPEEQAKVDEIVKERLARHKPDDYEDLKEIAEEVSEFFEGATPAEKKAAIKAYKEQLRQQQELEALENEAATTGKDPELLKEISELKREIAESKKVIEEITGERQAKKQVEEEEKKKLENWNRQIAEFKADEECKDIDLDALEKDEDFIEYAKDHKGTLLSIYKGFVKFTSKLKEKTAEEVRTKYKSKELSSTGSGKGGNHESGDYGLTERQKSLAKSNGMTYKEYAALIKYAE